MEFVNFEEMTYDEMLSVDGGIWGFLGACAIMIWHKICDKMGW